MRSYNSGKRPVSSIFIEKISWILFELLFIGFATTQLARVRKLIRENFNPHKRYYGPSKVI